MLPPSTLGTFVRALTLGHVRQPDALLRQVLVCAWRAGAGPAEGRLVIDVDSFFGEVCGCLRQCAAYGYTKVLACHPILATQADTRSCSTSACARGSANMSEGMLLFTDELITCATRASPDREAVACESRC